MKYDIVLAVTKDLLVLEVQNKISNGWQPLGGLCAASLETPNGIIMGFYQAMIKTE